MCVYWLHDWRFVLAGQNLTLKRKKDIVSIFKLLNLVGGICVCMVLYFSHTLSNFIASQVYSALLCFLSVVYFMTRVNSLNLFMFYFSCLPRPAYELLSFRWFLHLNPNSFCFSWATMSKLLKCSFVLDTFPSLAY